MEPSSIQRRATLLSTTTYWRFTKAERSTPTFSTKRSQQLSRKLYRQFTGVFAAPEQSAVSGPRLVSKALRF